MKQELKNFAKKIYASSINVALTKAVTFGISIILARILEKSEYGAYAYLYATVLLIQTIAGFAMSGTTSKYIGLHKNAPKKQEEIALFAIIIATIGGVCGGVAYYTASRLGLIHIIDKQSTDIVISVGILAGTITPAIRGIGIGHGKLKALTVANLFTAAVYIPILYILVNNFGLIGATYSIAIYFVLELVTCYVVSSPIEKQGGTRSIAKLISSNKSLLHEFSLPSAISGMLISATTWFGLSVLNNSPNGKEELAEFAISNQWRMILLLLPAVIENATIPIISYAAKYETKSVSRHLVINIATIGGVGLIATIILTLFAREILKLYGDEYIEATSTFRVMIVAGYAYALNAVVGQFISATGNMWHGLALNGIWCVVYIYCIITLGQSAQGLAYSLLISYISHLMLQAAYVATRSRQKNAKNSNHC